ncbi:MAG: hypothetical protein AAGD47_05575 [Pseudomonadota bacterium]
MIRMSVVILALFAVVALGAIGAMRMMFEPLPPLAARFQPEDCDHITLVDRSSEMPVIGIEDIAVMPDGRLLLSAQNRLANEAGKGPGAADGLFVVNPADLRSDMVLASRIYLPDDPDLRPHGIAVSDNLMAVINRAYGSAGFETASLRIYALGMAHPRLLEVVPGLCAANNVAIAEAGREATSFFVTLDRGSCPETSPLDVVLPHGRGAVVSIDFPGPDAGIETQTGFTSPNGIVANRLGIGDSFVVAETRRDRLYLGPGDVIALPGSPDNLTLQGSRDVIVALHPSLPKLGLYRYGWAGSAASRIARVNLDSREVEILFDDPEGGLLSGATVGMMILGRLYAGSVRDAGLLVCEAA